MFCNKFQLWRAWIVRPPKQVINAGMVKICDTGQDLDRHIPDTIFIIAVSAAGQAEQISQLLLCCIVIHPKRFVHPPRIRIAGPKYRLVKSGAPRQKNTRAYTAYLNSRYLDYKNLQVQAKMYGTLFTSFPRTGEHRDKTGPASSGSGKWPHTSGYP